MRNMFTEVFEPVVVNKRVMRDEAWYAWVNYLSNQQEHECPPDCKGEGCHIEQKMLECPPLSEWRHGL